MIELPIGWADTKIGELCHLVNGRAFKPTDWGNVGLPIIRIQNLNRPDAAFNHFDGTVSEKFLVRNGDLLFAWSGTPGTSFGAHIWDGSKAILNQHIFNVRYNRQAVDKAFFRYAINQTLDEQIAKAHGGVGLRHVTKGKFEETDIGLPPLPEQRRIVAKVDSLSAKSRRARERLDHVPRLVEKYKQAILMAEYAEAQRRSEQTATLGSISLEVRNGLSKKPTDDPAGFPILRISAVRSMTVRLQDVRYYPDNVPEAALLRDGDLLFTRYNGNPDFTAVCGMVAGLACQTTYPDKLIRVRLSDAANPKFVEAIVAAGHSREWLAPHIKTAAGQHGISGADLKLLPIPLPALAQQDIIARRVETAFNWIDRLASEVTSARKLIDHLDQAILAKAFRGELVPQNPNDEPASVLLERIRAERQAVHMLPRRNKSGKAAEEGTTGKQAKRRRNA
jgi:type I restriction enzyme, S subunit